MKKMLFAFLAAAVFAACASTMQAPRGGSQGHGGPSQRPPQMK